jgi:hypothetical protein
MIRLIGLWLMGCAVCVTPVAADEDTYDGPTAIKPLTVTPKPQHSAAPNTVCDFEHQCYPEKGGPVVPTPPVVVAKPAAPRPQVPDEPIVATWRDCMDRALKNYEQSHDLHALQVATGSCQVRLEQQGGEDYAGVNLRPRWRRHRPMADGTSVAAGGPSAAMPTATVRRGVGASDDRNWDAQRRTQGSLSVQPQPRTGCGLADG